MSEDKDVTWHVNFDNPDDESLPITKCICGAEFPSWHFVISIYRDDPVACPECGRRFYFRNSLKVYEVTK